MPRTSTVMFVGVNASEPPPLSSVNTAAVQRLGN
jgi:hypothetical protein